MNITSFSVKNWQFTIILFILVLCLGINALFQMPRGEDPPFGAPLFIVAAIYPGTSPVDMEKLVADPIEEVLYNLSDVKKIVTNCSDGLMLLQVDFNFGVDVDNKNNDVIREVNRIRPNLPAGIIEMRIERASSSDVVILQSALVSETASTEELRIQSERLKNNLDRIKDIKWVRIQANPQDEILINLNLDLIARSSIGLNQVMGAIQANNINIPGGTMDIGKRRFNIKTNSELKSIQDIENIIVKPSGQGSAIHLKDIANIRMTRAEDLHLARFNGQSAVWVLTALKDRKNIIQTRKEIESVLIPFAKQLPSHIKLEHAFDQEKSVTHRLSRLAKDFSIAIFLVLLTLLPLGSRASLVVLISIPLSLSIGLALLFLFGYTLNQLSIVGMVIALGLLVDDSIVIVENIERFMRLGYDRKEAAIIATKQISVAVLGCTATLLLAFLPLTFLPEGAGDFIRSLPMAVLLTVLASLFVAMTIIPFLSSIFLKKHEQSEGNFFMRAFKKYVNAPYGVILKWAFRHPVLTLLMTLVIFLGSLLLVPKMGFSLFPLSEKPMFTIDIHSAPGGSLQETNRIARWIEQDLMTYSEVISVSTNVGKGNPRVYYNVFQSSYAPGYAQIFITLKQEMDVPQITAFTDKLRNKYNTVPGGKIEVKMFAQGVPSPAPIEFRIVGDNLDSLSHYGKIVEDIVKKTPGTIYVNNDLRLPRTDIQVEIDKEKAGILGILPAEVAKTIRFGLAGLSAGTVSLANGEEYNIKLSTQSKNQEEALAIFDKLYITSLVGTQIPLKQFARIKLGPSAPVIRHFNKERYASITSFTTTGYNTMEMIGDLEKKLESTPLPAGFRYVTAGEKESREESFGGMGTIVLITVFVLFAILVLEFKTFKSTLIVLSVVPLGIVGALIALYFAGETLSFVATIGMIALMGIEIKNSILLVDYTNHLRENGMSLQEAIWNGAETRFLPILLTSLTAIGGMIPLVLEKSPLISPLALVLIGGLISSTLLSRIVTPLLYLLIPPAVKINELNK